MKSKTSTEYSRIVSSVFINDIPNTPYTYFQGLVLKNGFKNNVFIYYPSPEDLVGKYLSFDEKYYGPILAVTEDDYIVTDSKLPIAMELEEVDVYEKKSVTTTTYPPFYHKAKKGQSLYVKKNGAIGNEPDVYVKTGGTIKKLY